MTRKPRRVRSVSLSTSGKLNLVLRPLASTPDVQTNDELQLLDLGLLKVNGSNMFFCQLCRVCIPLEAMDTHLTKTENHVSVCKNADTRQAFDNLGGYGVPMKLPPISPQPICPISALPTPVAATRCSLCSKDDPHAIWKTSTAKSRHKMKKHPEQKLILTGTRVYVQLLFPKAYGSYNSPLQQVDWNPRLKSASTGRTRGTVKEQMLQALLDDLPESSKSSAMPKSTGFADTNPLLWSTGWAEAVQGLDPNDLITAVAFPSRGDPLERVIGPTKALFLKQQGIIKKAYPPILRKWMKDSSAQPILSTLGKEGTESYRRRLVRFVAFVLRVEDGLEIVGEEGKRLQLFLTDEQSSSAKNARAALSQGDDMPQAALQQLLVSCFAPTDTSHLAANKFNDIVQIFCMLSTIDRTGRFSEAKNITSPLAAMQYIMRSVLLQKGFDDSESLSVNPDQSRPHDPDKIFDDIQTRFLTRDSISPYGGLQDLKSKVWTYTRTSTSLPNVQWVGSNHDRVVVNGKTVSLEDMKLLVDQLRVTANYLLHDEMLLGVTLSDLGFDFNPGDELVDDLSCLDPGYSVFSEEQNQRYFEKGRETLLYAFVDNDHARAFFYDEKVGTSKTLPSIRRDRIRIWLKRWGELQEVTALLMHILGGQPARCSELMKMYFENTANRFRHLYWLDGRFFFLACMSKTTNITSKDRIIPHGLPSELNELILISNGFIRPVAAAFTKMLSLPTEKIRAQQQEFFNTGGDSITSAQISARMQSVTQSAVGTSLGIADWRHLSILIMRKLFKLEPGEEQLADPDEENIYDLQAGHSSSAARKHYAVEPMEWHLMRNDTLAKYMKISDQVSGWYLDFNRAQVPKTKRGAKQNLRQSPSSESDASEHALSHTELDEAVSDDDESSHAGSCDSKSSDDDSNGGKTHGDHSNDSGSEYEELSEVEKTGRAKGGRSGKQVKGRIDTFAPPRASVRDWAAPPMVMRTRASKRARHD